MKFLVKKLERLRLICGLTMSIVISIIVIKTLIYGGPTLLMILAGCFVFVNVVDLIPGVNQKRKGKLKKSFKELKEEIRNF